MNRCIYRMQIRVSEFLIKRNVERQRHKTIERKMKWVWDKIKNDRE